MSDIISRKAAIDAIITLWANKPFGNPALTEIKECVERVPSAQPEIVRCGDCRYWESAKDPDDGGRCIADGFQLTDREWYCADGERREE